MTEGLKEAGVGGVVASICQAVDPDNGDYTADFGPAVTAIAARIELSGTELLGSTPEEVQDWVQRDTDKWGRVIRDAGFLPKQRDTLYRTYFLN